MIKFYEGSVFDSKCDLLILPCGAGGSQTHFVRNEIIEHDLPRLDSNVEWGNVEFILNTGGNALAIPWLDMRLPFIMGVPMRLGYEVSLKR